MALTFTKVPPTYQPGFNEMWYDIVSDQIVNNQFKYVVEVYVVTITTRVKRATITQFPLIDGHARFDIKGIIQNYLVNEFLGIMPTTGDSLRIASNQEIIQYEIVAYESYIDIYGDQQNTPYTENLHTCWTAAFDYNEYLDLTNSMDKLYPSFSLGEFLNYRYYGTGFNNNIIAESSDPKVLSFFVWEETGATGAASVDIIEIKTYTNTGQNKYFQLLFDPTTVDVRYNIMHFSVALDNLNANSWDYTLIPGGLSSTITPIEDMYFEVKVGSWYDPATTLIPYVQFYKTAKFVIGDCSIYDKFTVFFATKYGSYGWVKMDKKHDRKITTLRDGYTKISNPNYGGTYSLKPRINEKVVKNWTLRTDYLQDQSEIDMIEDMITSNFIFIFTDNKYFPVNIADGDYSIEIKNQNGMVYYEITFEEAFDQNYVI